MRAAFTILFFILLCSNSNVLNAQNAPIATIGQVVSDDTTAVVPITVTGFSDISICDLALTYDPEIAAVTSVTLGPGVMYNFFIPDFEMPGTILLAWFYFQGLTIPDDSVFITITFERIAYGYTAIEFDNSLPNNCIWGDASSTELNDSPDSAYYIDGSVSFEMINAPMTSAPNIEDCQGAETVDIPVAVSDFYQIGAFNLTMQYDTLAFAYQSFTNESGFPGLEVFENSPGMIVISGISDAAEGITYESNAILCIVHFNPLGGSTAISWFDNGESCEYRGPAPDYSLLNDVPQSAYYSEGSFIELPAPVISVEPVSPDTVIAGAGTANFSIAAIGEGLTYQWQEYSDNWNDLIDGGVYSGANTAVLTITDPPVVMDGYYYRCIVSGTCEPPAISDGTAQLSVVVVSGYDVEEDGDCADHSRLYVKLYPNPFAEQITFTYNAPSEGKLIIEIANISGGAVAVFSNLVKSKGNEVFSINTEHLISGIYLATITFKGEKTILQDRVKIISNSQ